MPKLDRSAVPSIQFWGVLIILAVLFLLGGSSRGDVQSLPILNPAMIICCGAALLTLTHEHLSDRKYLAYAVGLVFLLAGIYLAPLPGQLEAFARVAGEVDDVRDAANVSNSLQILATAPYAAWQSFFFLFAPLAVLLFAVQLSRDDLRLILPVLIVVGTISGIVGVLQLADSANGPLYLYRITNNGSAVGLFANRNHAAVLLACIFPMLGVIASKSTAISHSVEHVSKAIAIGVAILLVPLILVTGSRSGMLAAVIGLIGGALLYSSHVGTHQERKKGTLLAPMVVVTVILGLVLTTIFFSRAEAIDRIFAEPNHSNDRAVFWTSSLQMFWQYFPFGFGPGGFVPAFQIDEPLNLLASAYLNRLHNDWLETALTFGIPGIILLFAGTIYYLRRSFVLWGRMDGERSGVALGRMASILIAILAVASMSDYPLRTPAMAGFGALVLVWFAHARPDPISY